MRLLNRTQVIDLLDPTDLFSMMRAAFETYDPDSDTEHGTAAQRVPFSLPATGTDNRSGMLVFPGIVDGIPAYTVKVHAKYPTRDPSIRGILLLHDIETGALLSAMDSTHLTAVRTGLTAALATDVLCREDARSVAVVGAGVQGEFLLRFLSVRRSLGDVTVYDTDSDAASSFVTRLSKKIEIDGELVTSDSLAGAIAGRDIVLCATWAEQPFLSTELVMPGTHITTLGSDQPGKAEISPRVIEESVFVCDDRDLTVEMGAIGSADLSRRAIDATLTEVLTDNHPGRVSPDETTIFSSVGLAFQDLVAAWQVYRHAEDANVGDCFDLTS